MMLTLEHNPWNEMKVRRFQQRRGEAESLFHSTGPTHLYFPEGQQSMTLGYLRSMAREGLTGLQQIPRWALVR